jgi:hypothetical protein
MKWLSRIMIVFVLLTIPLSYGCSKHAVAVRKEKQRRKELSKKQVERELEAQAAYETAVERHYNLQTKETQKAMRQTMKKSNALKENKKPSFLKRWFAPKTKKKKHRPRGT